MARRPFPDPTKGHVGVLTMVYKDYFFLRKWYDYYKTQFGAEHLYIISHGNDPEHHRIAPDANIIPVPRDPTLTQLERRRWGSLSHISSGLLSYYNWIICTDVDEIVVYDPGKAANLSSYFDMLGASEKIFRSYCPLGLEIIHNPALEPGDIAEDRNILSQRRIFRINANYSKPCLLRYEGRFTVGGHANTHLPRVMADDLYLIHLRFFDYAHSYERLKSRRDMRQTMNNAEETDPLSGAWANDIASLEDLSSRVPEKETIDFPEFRQKMVDGMKLLHNDTVAFWGGGRTKEVYRLPERFGTVF
jgi:hypothetical protein